MQVKKQQLEPHMEQWTSFKLGKDNILSFTRLYKAIYCHPAYLTYMQSTTCKMPGWMNHKMESSFLGDFIFLSSKITADGDCSHESKRHLLLGRKAMKNLDSILKSRDITLPTKVHLVKAMVSPVVMYACESWTVKKAEC